ncbi:small subunit ribosomal protein S18e [Sarotherodon galilaeus]
MRSSDAAVHRKHDRFDLKRSRKSGRRGLPVSEGTSQTLESSVQRFNRSSSKLHTVSRLTTGQRSSQTTGQRSSQTGQSELKQAANIPLPPIRGSRPVGGRGEVPAAPPAIRNTILHVFVAKRGKPIQQSDRLSEIHGRPALAERLEQQKSDDIIGVDGGRATTMLVTVKDDGGACEERRQQREFCSNDSAAETLSEDSEVRGHVETPEEEDGGDDEYYSEQRITEWILQVNSSLFSTGNTQRGAESAEERDVATIKIIYSGD